MPKLSDPYSYPPRGLSHEEAARYIGVGTTKFDEMVGDKRMPKPKKIDERLVWDRISVDAAFSDLPADNENLIDMIVARRDIQAAGSAHDQKPSSQPSAKTIANTTVAGRLIGLKEVRAMTSLGSTTIYRKMAEETFPQARRLSANCVRWMESDIENWMSGLPVSGK